MYKEAVMISYKRTYHFIFSFITLLIPSQSFQSPAKWHRQHRYHHKTILCQQSNERNNNDETTSWALSEDWALMDKVPKYTIGTSSQSCTFWTQLLLSTNELSSRSESEAVKRYQYLLSNNNNNNDDDDDTTISTTLPPLRPSPVILQDWWIDTSTGMVSGQIDNGSTIWFTSQCMGRLPEDPARDMEGMDEMMTAYSGGFVEAIGGRIYELGKPRIMGGASAITGGKMPSPTVSDEETSPRWSSTMRTSIAALTAASLLSIFIGFGMGTYVGTINSSPTLGRPGTQSAPIVLSPRSSSTTTTNTDRIIYKMGGSTIEPSVSEKRARVEAKVLQEKRVIQAVQMRLEQDQAKLAELRQQE